MAERDAVTGAALPEPAVYFPVDAGDYVMKAGLRRLGTDFGNGAADGQLFQLDREWPRYRANKLQARAESLPKYYCTAPQYTPGQRRAVTALLLHRLVAQHPQWFHLAPEADGGSHLQCRLSGETLWFDADFNLLRWEGNDGPQPAYRDSVDALACQIQEDLSIVGTAPENEGRIVLLHLCAPNHWSAAERIGRSFRQAHAPVPQFDRIARHTPALLRNLRDAGPYVRFAWGLATDRRLNHHPEAPPGCTDDHWQGRRLDVRRPQLYLRVERQVLAGLPAADCFVFAIRTYFRDTAELPLPQRQRLAQAVRRMDPEIARYKGLLGQQETIARWLQQAADPRRSDPVS